MELDDIVSDISGGGDATRTTEECVIALMEENDVVWHSDCRNAVNAQKVVRAEERINKSAFDNDSDSEVTSMTPMKTRGGVAASDVNRRKTCFFCEETITEKIDGRAVSSLEVDEKIRDAAQILGDGEVISKLLHHDMVALKAVYHPTCLTNYYKSAGRREKKIINPCN
jgi:hypothetical protein